MARLLVFTPTYGDGPIPGTVESVQAQQFDGELVHEVSYFNPYPGERNLLNVTAQYQRARQMTIDGAFDGLVTVEHDMELLPNCVARMWELSQAHSAPVVYSPYLLRHGTYVLSVWQYKGEKSLGMSLSLFPKELKAYRKQGWGEVSGVGFGCTLIEAETLAMVGIKQPEGNHSPDMPFAYDCLRQRIKQIGAFDVPSKHYSKGVFMDAYADNASKARVLALTDVTISVDGSAMPLKKGSYYTIPRDIATEQERAGYLKLTIEEPKFETTEAPSEREVAVEGKAKRGRPKRAS